MRLRSLTQGGGARWSVSPLQRRRKVTRGWNMRLADPNTVSQASIKAANDRTDADYLAEWIEASVWSAIRAKWLRRRCKRHGLLVCPSLKLAHLTLNLGAVVALSGSRKRFPLDLLPSLH